jgi:Tfp pilus assembly protein PilF
MEQGPASHVLAAIECLKRGERDGAAALLGKELQHGPPTGEGWTEVQRVAAQIGEIEIALEAARRFSLTEPASLERVLHYCRELAEHGRVEEALLIAKQLPAGWRDHASVLHFLGTRALQAGEFGQAEQCYRRATDEAPLQSWALLAMAKEFTRDDPDFAAMERLLPRISAAPPALQARFLYSLAKACHECGEFDRAWDLYARGAMLRKRHEPWDPGRHARFADDLITRFTAEAMKRLTPLAVPRRPALFVTGLPRSGTTLVEQMLLGHSQIADSAEFNLLRASLIPTLDYSFDGALRYQERFGPGDPWGKLAAAYFRMLEMRFRTDRLVIDKSPLQSFFMGLLLHMLPDARVVWLRRDPEDTALSCLRAFFSAPVAWTWSLEDIGRFFRVEDRLFAHWTELFPGRILTVSYEELVREPLAQVSRIVDFAGLPMEPHLLDFHRAKRTVRTASLQQVRSPVSTKRIGAAKAYAAYMDPFRKAYRG